MEFGKVIVRLGMAAMLSAGAAPALAELPPPVRAMIVAAAETGDADKLKAVVEVARSTNPNEEPAIDALLAAGKKRQDEIATFTQEAKKLQIREAGLFDNWHGQGELGASRSTGNSEDLGFTVAMRLERTGINWQHRLRASLDYQETNNITTREKYFASYEPRYQINPRLFAFALGQFDKDEFQGYEARYAVSGGLGYKLVDKPDMHLSVKAGPAWRYTFNTDGSSDNSLAALAGLDFDWRLAKSLKLTQTTDLVSEGGGAATAIIDGQNTTLSLVTGLEAKILQSLTARMSYSVDYDSNPPFGKKNTDTLSRFTLIYGF